METGTLCPPLNLSLFISTHLKTLNPHLSSPHLLTNSTLLNTLPPIILLWRCLRRSITSCTWTTVESLLPSRTLLFPSRYSSKITLMSIDFTITETFSRRRYSVSHKTHSIYDMSVGVHKHHSSCTIDSALHTTAAWSVRSDCLHGR